MASTNNVSDLGPDSSKDVLTTREAATASAREVREFVARLRGKKPQEVLGQIANSGLVQGVTISTIGTILIMAIFTAGPYFLYGKPVPLAKAEKAETPAVTTPATTPETAAVAPAATPDAKANPNLNTNANAQKTLDKLGESETKMADPKSNPLEKDVEDLLDSKK